MPSWILPNRYCPDARHCVAVTSLKPDNLLLTSPVDLAALPAMPPALKVIDWGLAVRVPATVPSVTQPFQYAVLFILYVHVSDCGL